MRYLIYDVFTDRPLAGNPLAVVPDADALGAERMQAIAAEFNLSETAFVFAPSDPLADVRARYFTPGRELPTAGHPTVGTAFALERLGRLPAGDRAVFELGVGPTELRLERSPAGALERVWMNQGLPRRERGDLGASAAAALLGLPVEAVAGPAEVWSCGNPFVIVPLADLAALGRVAVDPARLADLAGPGFQAVLPFVLVDARRSDDGNGVAPDVRCRMLTADLGAAIAEDPATGSAHGPLGGYLAAHGLLPNRGGAGSPHGDHDADDPAESAFVSHQGVEMGRPSELRVRVAAGGVWVGGGAVPVATGELEL